MADIAAVFHWPPSIMDAMSPGEISKWRARAIERFKAMQPR